MMEQDLEYRLTRVERESGGWVVRVPQRRGGALEYVYKTRRKARYMAAVFRLGPTWVPPPHRVALPTGRTASQPG